MFYEKASIQHQLTASCTPQQNGVNERKNRYIMEMTRCMLHEKESPKNFWADAANTTVFLQNRFQPRLWNIKHHSKLGMGINVYLSSSKCLVVCVLPMFHRSSMTKLTRKQFPVSLWVIVLSPKPTKCISHKHDK